MTAISLTTTGGKGDKPRKNSNQNAYGDGWELAFGKKDLTKEEIPAKMDVQIKKQQENT
jgi:hypothetical protein